MFRRESGPDETSIDEVAAAPAAPGKSQGADFATRTVSYVGPSVVFKGELVAHEPLTIEGEIEGTIRHDGRNLTIGKLGRVHAEIHAKVIDVRGRVDGEIHGEDIVHLFNTAEVTGTIHCKRILMDDGAQLNGTVDMSGESVKPRKRKLTVADAEPRIAKAVS